MTHEIDRTHDPKLTSWIESANDRASDFPIQNLPFGAFSRDDDDHPRIGVAIGDSILDLEACVNAGLFDPDLIDDEGEDAAHVHGGELDDEVTIALSMDSLNFFMSLGPGAWKHARARISALLSSENDEIQGNAALRAEAVVPMARAELHLPCEIGDYTDFYASVHHATNVGSMFRPDNPLLPNYKHIPVGYHGRASSVQLSGESVRRPMGQTVSGEGEAPTFGPCRLLDYEFEIGAFVGADNSAYANDPGTRLSVAEAAARLFGVVVVNDWSARDIQKWEYQPLGPFLAKNFATTVSPYIITMEALAPFRTPAFTRPDGDPKPLPYLYSEANEAQGGFDIVVEAWLSSKQMRDRGMSPIRLSRGNFKDMYWTIGQMLAHHSVNGCRMQPGDLLASGTISGPSREARGCMLELTWDGDPWADPPSVVPGTQRTPIELLTGETRTFLEDGDEVILKAYCEREGFRRIGFGECRGVVEAARG